MVHSCNPGTQEAEAGGSGEFEASLSYMVRPCVKKGKQTNNTTKNADA
jgi:hypothetical protein